AIPTFTFGISQMLDKILQPITCHIPEIIIDTTHFILRLENLTLQPSRKYTLITIDIESLYTNLKLENCFEYCLHLFNLHKSKCNFPIITSESQLQLLMKWCLKNHYVQYEDDIFYQHRGIAMGSACSVSIANLTVFMELINNFQ